MRKLYTIVLFSVLATFTNAQSFYIEDFDGCTEPTVDELELMLVMAIKHVSCQNRQHGLGIEVWNLAHFSSRE